MRKILLLCFVSVAISFFLVAAISYDPGYVRISIGNWLLESNLWVLSSLVIAFMVAVSLSYKVIKTFLLSHHKVAAWLGTSRANRAKQTTNQGLLALLEGNWPRAKKLLSRSAAKSDFPLVNYLAAAHAANESGDDKEAQLLLKQAYETNKDSEFAVGIAQAQIQLRTNQLEPCLATLIRLRKQDPNHPYLLKLLKAVYTRLEDWQQLAVLIPALRKIDGQDKQRLEAFEKQVWQSLFAQKREELERTNQLGQSAAELAELWKQIPENLRFEEPLIKTYAEQLMIVNQGSEAERLLRKVLNSHWSDSLIELYGLIQAGNQSEQLISAENWLKQRPNNPTLLLTLGRLALRNELWGKAWEYLNASNKLHPSQTSYAELCRLSEKMSTDKSTHQALVDKLIATIDLPALPLPK